MDTFEATIVNFVIPIIMFYAVAYVIHRMADTVARRFKPLGDLTMRKNPRRLERQKTLQSLLSNVISILGFGIATLLTMTLFVSVDTLIWVIGLFSAAFGLGARPFISDYLTGLTFFFEDIYDVGDKIEIPMSPQRVEGVVEKVNLRITQIRGMDGELFTMPNGDIRLVRNFSRGEFSPTSVTLKVPASELTTTLEKLDTLGEEAMTYLPNLIQPWQVISQTGALGEEAELTILAKAKFGKGAEMRTRMLAYLQDELHFVEASENKSDEPEQESLPLKKSGNLDDL